MNQASQSKSEDIHPPNAGAVWYALHSEREEICAALNRNTPPAHQPGDLNQDEKLQARMRLINDALDRLMDGSYGHCLKCGSGIELDADPAFAFCLECERANQPSAFEYLPASFTSLNGYAALG